ncbi:hypothetical protein ANCCAN_08489 [Ancylostoma caninum]|uniref:Uncharacterized protein n=1 Tax=Ancylostoma caninum TaxID=29170 RepID=A0A368GQC4_ANCCA|nr:hypothetical protein ANCCAN_08489 [Ancylostoma caninum]
MVTPIDIDVQLESAFLKSFNATFLLAKAASIYVCADHSYSSQLYVTSHDNLYDAEDSVDLTTEEEDEEAISQAVAERVVQLDEDSGSVPEDEGRPARLPPEPEPERSHIIPDLGVNRSGPLIGGRSLRPRKRKQYYVTPVWSQEKK